MDDNGINLLFILMAAVAGGAFVWLFARRNMPPEEQAWLEQAIAQIRGILGDVFTTDDVELLAGWFWDSFVKQSDYWTREQFVDRIVRAIAPTRTSALGLRTVAQAQGIIPVSDDK